MEWRRPSNCSDAACVEVKIKTNQVRGAKAGEFDLERP